MSLQRVFAVDDDYDDILPSAYTISAYTSTLTDGEFRTNNNNIINIKSIVRKVQAENFSVHVCRWAMAAISSYTGT